MLFFFVNDMFVRLKLKKNNSSLVTKFIGTYWPSNPQERPNTHILVLLSLWGLPPNHPNQPPDRNPEHTHIYTVKILIFKSHPNIFPFWYKKHWSKSSVIFLSLILIRMSLKCYKLEWNRPVWICCILLLFLPFRNDINDYFVYLSSCNNEVKNVIFVVNYK